MTGWLTRVDILEGLWPPLTAALYLTLRFQVLPTTPRGSHLLCHLPPTELTHEGLVFFNSLARIFLRMFLCHGYPLLSILYHHQGAAQRGYALGVPAATQNLPSTKSSFLLSFLYVPPASFQSRQQQSYLHQFELIFQLSYCIISTQFPRMFDLLLLFFCWVFFFLRT